MRHGENRYIPDAGDLVWTNFAPQTGREQSGKRPALILTPKAYNSKTGLAIMVPITSQIKGYPFEVPIRTKTINGVVLTDHVKNLDWMARGASFAGKASSATMEAVKRNIATLIGI